MLLPPALFNDSVSWSLTGLRICRTTLTITDIGSNVIQFDPTTQPIHLKVALFSLGTFGKMYAYITSWSLYLSHVVLILIFCKAVSFYPTASSSYLSSPLHAYLKRDTTLSIPVDHRSCLPHCEQREGGVSVYTYCLVFSTISIPLVIARSRNSNPSAYCIPRHLSRDHWSCCLVKEFRWRRLLLVTPAFGYYSTFSF